MISKEILDHNKAIIDSLISDLKERKENTEGFFNWVAECIPRISMPQSADHSKISTSYGTIIRGFFELYDSILTGRSDKTIAVQLQLWGINEGKYFDYMLSLLRKIDLSKISFKLKYCYIGENTLVFQVDNSFVKFHILFDNLRLFNPDFIYDIYMINHKTSSLFNVWYEIKNGEYPIRIIIQDVEQEFIEDKYLKEGCSIKEDTRIVVSKAVICNRRS